MIDRRFFARYLPMLALAIALLPAAFACGGGGDDSAKDPTASSSGPEKVRVSAWTKGLCVSFIDWLADIETETDKADFSSDEPDAVKKVIVDYLDTVTRRSVRLKKDVDELGYPDMKDGKKIEAALSGAAGDVVTIFQASLKEARALDTKDPAKLAKELERIGESLQSASDEVGDAFSQIDVDYDTSELVKAADKIPECEGFFVS